MRVKIRFLGGFEKDFEEVEVEKGMRYHDLLKRLGINPETVVVVKDGKPVPVDDFVEEGEITVMRVISGG